MPGNGETLSEKVVLEAVRPVRDPELGRSLVELGAVKARVEGGRVSLSVRLHTPTSPYKAQLESDLRTALLPVPGVAEVSVAFGFDVSRAPTDKASLVPTVKNVVLVGSGKGGVGKSTVAVNLAIALARSGAKVGLLDADIYGPSIPIMLGARHARPQSGDGKSILPVEAHGLKVISIGFFVDPEQAMVWRGPMLHGAITQFFRDVVWGELDYLVLDLPPGTGDIQLTIAQQVKVAGAVVVTTPQDVSLADAIKAKSMFDKVDVPVLGIVENMSYFHCPKCHERTEIFAHGGGAAAAKKLQVPFLGEVPLVTSIREGGDAGVPVTVGAPNAPESLALCKVAERVAAEVARANLVAQATRIASPDGRPLVQIKL
jgi:ATP-binding protein involved in chromosome partitioning